MASLILIFSFKKIRKIFVIIFLITLVLIPIIDQKIFYRFYNHTSIQLGLKEATYVIDNAYPNHYKTAYEIFKDHPILGTGPQTFRKACSYEKYKKFDGCSTHPHNTFMQLLSETGVLTAILYILIFGFLAFNLLRVFFYKYVFKKSIFKDYYLILLINYFVMLFPIVPSGNFFNNWMSIIFFLPLGFGIKLTEQKIQKK